MKPVASGARSDLVAIPVGKEDQSKPDMTMWSLCLCDSLRSHCMVISWVELKEGKETERERKLQSLQSAQSLGRKKGSRVKGQEDPSREKRPVSSVQWRRFYASLGSAGMWGMC